MNLKNLSSDELLNKAKEVAASERKIYSEIISVLEEIENRKLYLGMGFSSLFSFCKDYLKYSDGAAQRRIESMRLIKNFPRPQKEEVKNKLESGSINLTHLSQVAKALRAIPKPKTCYEKMQLIAKVEGTSSRQCEERLMEEGAPRKTYSPSGSPESLCQSGARYQVRTPDSGLRGREEKISRTFEAQDENHCRFGSTRKTRP